jgi:hypothetical protein
MVEKLFSLFVILIFISLLNFVYAGPYGYGDSMDLEYRKVDGKIVYGYGDGVKHETSLRPKNVNWSEWREMDVEISRGKVIDKSWEEIDEAIKNGESIGEEKVEKVSIINNLITSIIDKVNNLFLRLVESKQVPIEYDSCGMCVGE